MKTLDRFRLVFLIIALILFFYAAKGEADMYSAKHYALHTVVSVIMQNGGHGSGISVFAGPNFTYILTARHVVANAEPGSLTVRLYPSGQVVPAARVKVSDKYDLALLRIDVVHEYVAQRGEKRELEVFTPVFKVGGAIGRKPFPTEGIVTEFSKDTGGLVTSAQIFFGDSGGGIFTMQDGQPILVGIAIALPMWSKHYPVAHIALCYNIYAIEEFLTTP